MVENTRGKRGDPSYKLISGYVPKELALLFKNIFVATETDQSHIASLTRRDVNAPNSKFKIQN
ncbi:hypothetical protein [Nostoc sp.]|uniref:hypothetical protein n=1 Tax=Nostoc sp. TaxID=1180 RepID=UPI002FF9B725